MVPDANKKREKKKIPEKSARKRGAKEWSQQFSG